MKVLLVLTLCLCATLVAKADWTRVLGGAGTESGSGVSVLASTGDVYVAGSATASVQSQTYQGGSSDALVAKYNGAGVLQWTRLLGSGQLDTATGVNAFNDSAYVVGFTAGSFGTQTNAGGNDGFITLYSGTGTAAWTAFVGSSGNDVLRAVTSNSAGAAFAVGNSNSATVSGASNNGGTDALVVHVRGDGQVQWARQLGGSGNEDALGVAFSLISSVEALFVVGSTSIGAFNNMGTLGGTDGFAARYGTDGTLAWTVLLGGVSNDVATSVALSTTSVYVTGYSSGVVAGQPYVAGLDVFLYRLDFTGNVNWARAVGGSGDDAALAVSVSPVTSSIYLAGYTTSPSFANSTNAGGEDVFFLKYDILGNSQGGRLMGGTGNERVNGLFVTATQEVLLGAGSATSNPFNAQAVSGQDAATLQLNCTAGDCSFFAGASACGTAVPPALDITNSQLISGNLLRLVFTASPDFASVTFRFQGQPRPECNFDGTTATNQFSFWSTTPAATGSCSSLYTLNLPVNTGLSNCSFTTDESVAGTTVFSTQITIRTVEIKGAIRGLPINQTLETGVQIQIAYSTTVNASSPTQAIFGSRITASAILSQTFDPQTYTATLILTTSLQYPYQFFAPSIGPGTGFTSSIVPTFAESNNNTKAVCNSTMNAGNDQCVQYWTITIRRQSNCNPGPSTLDFTGWNVSFLLSCHANFPGGCSSIDPPADGVVFSTTSPNYCPQLINNDNSAATATLTTYTANTFANDVQNSVFVFGSPVFFQAVVTSTIVIEALRAERVTIVTGAPNANIVVYQNPFTNASHYFGVGGPAGSYAAQLGGFSGDYSQSPSFMTLTDNVTATNNFQRAIRFSWVWSGATSSANTDASVASQVRIDMRIRYANQTVVSQPQLPSILTIELPLSSLTQQQRKSSGVGSTLATSSTWAQASVSVSATNSGNVNPTSSGSASAASTTVITVAVVIAAACVVVIVAIAAVYIVRRSRQQVPEVNKTAHLESVELNFSSSVSSLRDQE